MPSMGRPDNALLVFRWHFRHEGMALYPPKGLSERVEDDVSCPRRRPLFEGTSCLVCTEQTGRPHGAGGGGSAFWRPGKCLRMRRNGRTADYLVEGETLVIHDATISMFLPSVLMMNLLKNNRYFFFPDRRR